MSKIDDLIAELCPDGVEPKALGQLMKYEQPGRYLVASTRYSDEHPTPVLTAGQTFILGYTDEEEGVYPASLTAPVVIFDDFTTAFKWVDFAFKAKSSAMKMLTARDEGNASLRYIFYAMQTIRYTPQDHARQWIGTYSQFTIPVPPPEVQREIVRILDTFTELEAELKAELVARRRQYEHYRDWLYQFHETPTQSLRWTTMGDLGSFIRGRRFTKADYSAEGIPSIHYGEIYTHYGVAAGSALSHVRGNLENQLAFALPGDVVIAAVGETVEDVGKAVAWLGPEPVAIHDDTFRFRSELNAKYVSYFTQTQAFHSQKNQHVARAKVKRLSASGLAKIRIPVPSIEEQRQIVATLDKFDSLMNDARIGLPAELAARCKQYEHYRDRLLTFEERMA